MPLTLQIAGDFPAGVRREPLVATFRAFAENTNDLDGQINLVFVDDEEIREMNKEFAGNDYATDVLSFSYLEGDAEPIEGVVGEIAISYETAERQARDLGVDLSDEIALLALHGSLHIVGYDHQTVEERDRLSNLQREIMGAAGVPYRELEWQD